DTASAPPAPRNGPAATLSARSWVPPAPPVVLPAAFPDSLEVLVFANEGGAELVAAIELVSPANKDRAAHRHAFTIKCAGYLVQGVSLIVVDIVTSRQANLHNDLVRLLGHGEGALLPADASLYAVGYRPVVRGGAEQIDAWPTPLDVGQALPVLPLALNAE